MYVSLEFCLHYSYLLSFLTELSLFSIDMYRPSETPLVSAAFFLKNRQTFYILTISAMASCVPKVGVGEGAHTPTILKYYPWDLSRTIQKFSKRVFPAFVRD